MTRHVPLAFLLVVTACSDHRTSSAEAIAVPDGSTPGAGGTSSGPTGGTTGGGSGGTLGSGGGGSGGLPAGGGGSAASGGATAGGGGIPASGGATVDGSVATGGAGGAASLDAGPAAPEEGVVHVVKRMGDPSFDSVVTNPSASTVAWLGEHFWRMEVFTTFFDDKTSFYPNGWVYSDSQVVYPGSATATDHPDWILQDPSGKAVYLDWGCSNGACPQYAADVTNPGFRAAWIGALEAALAKGYRGAWIDDVNLALRFSDGSGATTAHSPTTNAVMTEDVWAGAVAAFMAEARAALTGYELLHNSIWYARPTRTDDALVRAQIDAADVINVEGGFASDGGLTGGTGEWSVSAKMAFVDFVHSRGRSVVVDDFPSNDQQREYALACYLLLSNGTDGLGDASMAPSTWWVGYDVRLGRALGPRTRDDSGLFRRSFERGVVLMLEPSAAAATVPLSGTYVTLGGDRVTEVALSAKHGAVLIAP